MSTNLIVVGVDPGVTGYATELEEVPATTKCVARGCDNGQINEGRGELGDGERTYSKCSNCGGTGQVFAPGVTAKRLRAIPIPTLRLDGKRRTYDRVEICRLVTDWAKMGVNLVVLEKQQVFPKAGGFANFLKGYGYACITTALAMAGVPFEEITPSDWKRQLGIALGGSSEQIKTRSIEKATTLFPNVDFRPFEAKPKSYTADHNKCESALLAEVAYRLVRFGRGGFTGER